MCGNCYEKKSEYTRRVMLFCKLFEKENDERERLCRCQRFCSDRNRFVPNRQKDYCKNYK